MKESWCNMDISRIPNPTDEDYKRMEKYKRSYEKLQDKRSKLC